MNSLVVAYKNKMTSIAFPAIGTGGLSYPPAIVAKVMIEEIRKFQEQTKNDVNYTPLSVYIVCKATDSEIIEVLKWSLYKSILK